MHSGTGVAAFRRAGTRRGTRQTSSRGVVAADRKAAEMFRPINLPFVLRSIASWVSSAISRGCGLRSPSSRRAPTPTGSRVNDVLLAAVAGGLRDLLIHHGVGVAEAFLVSHRGQHVVHGRFPLLQGAVQPGAVGRSEDLSR